MRLHAMSTTCTWLNALANTCNCRLSMPWKHLLYPGTILHPPHYLQHEHDPISRMVNNFEIHKNELKSFQKVSIKISLRLAQKLLHSVLFKPTIDNGLQLKVS